MKPVDHVAFQVDKPDVVAEWYSAQHGAKILYTSPTWAMIEFENIKFAFVIPGKHPPHIAFKVTDLSEYGKGKLHRDGSRSVYKSDPFGIIIEYVQYPEN